MEVNSAFLSLNCEAAVFVSNGPVRTGHGELFEQQVTLYGHGIWDVTEVPVQVIELQICYNLVLIICILNSFVLQLLTVLRAYLCSEI